jgi:hypothetical protein
MLRTAFIAMTGLAARGAEPDLNAWTEACRLNPAAGAMARLHEPDVMAALTSMAQQFGPAMRNLTDRVAALPAQRAPSSLGVAR